VGISYLFGCGGKALGAIIDPIGEIAPYLRAAEEVGVRIRYVVDTHISTPIMSRPDGISLKPPAQNMSSTPALRPPRSAACRTATFCRLAT
jgi:hypothetical protein